MKKTMFRILLWTMALILACGVIPAAADGWEWVCPACGETGNTGNFCPNCGAAKPEEWVCMHCGQAGNRGNYCFNCGKAKGSKAETGYAGLEAGLLMRLATRSGPGTEYDEPGTFFGNTWKQETVRVLGKSWDSRNSVWWVLVDFNNSGKASYRIWTGLKRVDADIGKVPEIWPIGQGTVSSTTETYRGPGGRYAEAKVSIKGWKDVLAYGCENGYVEVEFEQDDKMYRVWVPEDEASIDWGTDFSGEK